MIRSRREWLGGLLSLPLVGCAGTSIFRPYSPKPIRIVLPEIGKATLPSGATLYHAADMSVPLVAIAVAIRAGHGHDEIGREGLAQIMSSLLREGMAGTNRVALEQRYGRLGASVDAFVTASLMVLRCTVHRDQAAEALRLLADNLRDPTFADASFERGLDLHRIALGSMRADPESLAGLGLIRAELGCEPPSSTLAIGTASALDSQSLAQGRAWLAPLVRSDNAIVVLTGALDHDEARRWADDATQTWTRGYEPAPSPTHALPSRAQRANNVLVTVPKLAQAVIAFGGRRQPSTPRGVIEALADGMTRSVLHHELRTLRRVTYGLGSLSRMTKHGSFTQMTAVVEAAEVSRVTQRIRTVLLRLPSMQINEDDLDYARRNGMVALMADLSGAEILLRRLLDLAEDDRGPDLHQRQLDEVEQLDPATFSSVFQSLHPDGEVRLSIVGRSAALDYARAVLPKPGIVELVPDQLLGFERADAGPDRI